VQPVEQRSIWVIPRARPASRRGDKLDTFANASDGVKLTVNRSASSGTGPAQSDQGFQEES
jgi:hypothetical protein